MEVDDPRLGRIPSFDSRSRQYGVRKLLTAREEQTLKGRTWMLVPVYDQGIPLSRVVVEQIQRDLGLAIEPWDPSACTGFSAGYDLIAQPKPAKPADITPAMCFKIYRLAQTMDEWSGEDYEGSSVLGTCKAMAKLGYIGEYHWAFGIDEMLMALSHLGPVVVGTDWQGSMFDPKPNGLLNVSRDSRDTAGGHAYIVQSIIMSKWRKRFLLGMHEDIRSEPLLRIHNSWGKSWGRNGDAFMWASDMDELLRGVKYPGEARVTTSHFYKLAA